MTVEKYYRVTTMSINYGFIPCAGKGTRMGDLGREIAKPLWRVFDKSMLEVQTEYLSSFFNVKEIVINTHHNHYQFEKIKDLKILHEEKLLGSGGNIHNFKKNYPRAEKIIVMNPDINIFFSEKDLINLKLQIQENDFLMVCLPVPKNSSYNEVCVNSKGFFVEVNGPNKDKDYITYSGMGSINLKEINYVAGESGFFDTVINKKRNCSIFVPKDHFEYWDWGSLDLYTKNIKEISRPGHESMLKNFLIEIDALDPACLFPQSYRSTLPNSYVFTHKEQIATENTIIFSDSDGIEYSVEI